MQRKTRYCMTYSAKFLVVLATFHIISRKIDYLLDSVYREVRKLLRQYSRVRIWLVQYNSHPEGWQSSYKLKLLWRIHYLGFIEIKLYIVCVLVHCRVQLCVCVCVRWEGEENRVFVYFLEKLFWFPWK